MKNDIFLYSVCSVLGFSSSLFFSPPPPPPPPANGSMKRYESGGLDINFSGVSGFIVNAPSDMSEKLKRRQSVVVTV